MDPSNGEVVPENIMATFLHASDALACANKIRKTMESLHDQCEYRMAILTGRPVDITGDQMFEFTKSRLDQLCLIGDNQHVYIDKYTTDLAKKEDKQAASISGLNKELSENDLSFMEGFFEVLNTAWRNTDFKTASLHGIMGISKSQLYRKLKSLTGLSPNQLVHDMKLQNAAQELKKDDVQVAQVAYDNGFNSPAYFARSFKSRFGMSPSEYQRG